MHEDEASEGDCHLPPLTGEIVYAWPMVETENGPLPLASFELEGVGGVTPTAEAMAVLAGALCKLARETYEGFIEVVDLEVCELPGPFPCFTHRVTFHAPFCGGRDWLLLVAGEPYSNS